MNKITKQCVAAVASLAMAGTLCVAGAVVAGSSAWAADTCNNGAPWDTACATQNGSIEIDKYKDELEKNSSNQYVQSKKTKVEGAKFKVTPVKSLDGTTIDLKKPEDWLKVAAKIPTLNATPTSLASTDLGTPLTEQSTDVNGVTTFQNLGIGLYKVEETQAANGYEKLANPFFMTIPEITRKDNSKDNTYTYKVKVEPKNAYTKDAITKTVDTKGMVGVGDDVPYTISASAITTSGTEASKYTSADFTDFAVWDDVPTGAYEAAKTAVTDVKVVTYTKNKQGEDEATTTKDLTKNGDTNTASTYYKVEDPVAGNGTGTGTGKNGIDENYSRLKITFTEAGLGEIAKQRQTSTNVKVVVTLKFTLKKDTTLTDVVNKYGYQKGHNTKDTKPTPDPDPTPNPKSKVTLVNFQIKKVNGTDGTTPLGGAKFAIFAKEDDAKACAADPNRSDEKCKKADTSYAKGFENAADGTPAADKANPGLTNAFKVKAGETFYVVETAAPNGFALSPIVEKVLAYDDTTKPKGSVDPNGKYANGVFTYTFKDVPTKDDGSWFKLPKTGAAGVIIFALIGLGLVGSGMFVFLKNRKKEEEQAA